MRKDGRFLNRIASAIPVAAATVGMVLVFSGIVFFFVEDDSKRIYTVVAGLFILLLGYWFSANPFLINSRVNSPLREEADHFISLVRKLHRVKKEPDEETPPEGIKAAMLESVDRMMEI